MAKRDKIKVRQLESVEAEFREMLVLCLKQCADGRWNLFGAYDRFPEVERWVGWPEAKKLRDLATSIHAIRSESGERNELAEEFLRLCTRHRPNDPGEPKLARAFLARIDKLGNDG